MFNDTMICDDPQSAQAVTFARNVGVRSVTLEGDVYEPSGTMSGGAAPSGSGVLVRAQELRAAEERVAQARGTLEALEREEAAARPGRDAWRARTRELQIKEHELRLLGEQVGSSNAARVRASSSLCIAIFFVTETPLPMFLLDWRASRTAPAVYWRDGNGREGREGEAGGGEGGDQEA